ncbi:LVIVD repeat-containing protein [Haloparvum sp. AD34]
MRRRRVLRAAALGAGALGAGALGADDGFGTVSGTASDASTADPYEPLGTLDLEAAYEAVTDGRTVFVATGDGFAAVDVTDPADPTLLTRETDLLADRESGPLEKVYDVALDGTDLLVAGPAHGSSSVNAAVRFDVSDPAAPKRTGVAETPFPIHNGDLADGIAYLTGNDGDRNPLVMVDFAAGEVVGRWSVVDHDAAWRDVHSILRVVHDVTVVDGVAYLAYWDAGTHLVDVSDPANPTHLGAIEPYEPADLAGLSSDETRSEQTTPPGNHHYAAPNDDGTLLAVNKESWAVEADGDLQGGPGGIELYDVSDPAAPELLARIAPTESPAPTISGVWTTSHNFEFHGDRLYTSWYEAGVKLYDVSDPTAPTELAAWRDPATRSFWTAQVGVPGEFFVASSTSARAEPGLFVFPDRAGEQPDRPPMAAAVDGTSTPSGTATPTATPTETPSPPSTPTDTATVEDSAPGFGVGAGVLGIAGWAWRRRLHSGDDET